MCYLCTRFVPQGDLTTGCSAGSNGRRLDADSDDLFDLILGGADGRVLNSQVAVFIAEHIRRRRRPMTLQIVVVSFEIDGALEVGEPPGVVPVALLRAAKRLGYLIGSCSDRPISYQEALWERLGIAADFTTLKGHRRHERPFSALVAPLPPSAWGPPPRYSVTK